jgi:hypothetical protein
MNISAGAFKKGSNQRGVLYQNVLASAWERLDRLEGETYTRRTVSIEIGGGRLTAETYIVRPEYVDRLEETYWDFSEFLNSGKSKFRFGYVGYSHFTSSLNSSRLASNFTLQGPSQYSLNPMQNTAIVPRIVQVLMATTLPAANPETERRPGIRYRHPKEETARCRRRIIYRFLIIVPLDNYRPIMTLDIDRSGWRIVVMVMNLMLVVAVGVASMMPAVAC